MPVHPDVVQANREALRLVLDKAIAGTPRPLYDHLARRSNMPGPRHNEALLVDFAEMASGRGPKADSLLESMATLDADMARGGTEFEFIPMCAVAALGERGTQDEKAYKRVMTALHQVAEDLRFRVRGIIPRALARLGEAHGDRVITDLDPWMDGFFHSAAALQSFIDPHWITRIQDGELVCMRLEQAFRLLDSATRSASRYPGYKALVDAIEVVPGHMAARFGVPVFDILVGWTKSKEPLLRDAVEKNLKGSRLAGRHQADIDRVRKAIRDTTPALRDPNHYVGPTRSRGKKH